MTTQMADTAFLSPPPDLLRRVITEGATSDAEGPLQVTRVHFPNGKPVQFHLQPKGLGAGQTGFLAEWVGPDAAMRVEAEATRLMQQGQSGAFAVDAENGLLLRRPGVDARLPGLRLLSDSAFAAARLAELGLKGPFQVQLVAHRLGKRAVLRIRHMGRVAFARLRSPTSPQARLAVQRHDALYDALASQNTIRMPRPMGRDEDLGLALYDALPGRTPALRGLAGFSQIEAVMQALIALQSTAVEAPTHQAADEMAVLDGWFARLTPVFPDIAAAIAAPLERLRQDLAALPPRASVLCHRDLHEGQILIDRGVAGLLDFDTLRWGDPALDLGNLQAHLVLAGLRSGRSLAAYATAAERNLTRVPLARIALWRRAAVLRLAMIYALTAEPRATISALIDEAA